MDQILFIQKFFGPEAGIAVIQILVVVFSVCCHEYAHARTALWQGDPTAADAGHLTLNPMKQMGTISLIMLLFIGLAWGMVPTNPSRMRHRWSDALVSAAGPLMNVLLFCVFLALLVLAEIFHGPVNLLQLAFQGAMLNVLLGLLNLCPVPGLDGWNIAHYLFPRLFGLHSEWQKGALLLTVLGLILLLGKLEYVSVWLTVQANGQLLHLLMALGVKAG